MFYFFGIIIEAGRIMTEEAKKVDFYITYHHADEMAARWIASVLKNERFTTLSDSWDFLTGETPPEKLDYALTLCRVVAVLVSEKFLQTFSGPPVPSAAKLIIKIDRCEIEKALGVEESDYLDLAGIKETEAVNRLLQAVGAAAPDKKETGPRPYIVPAQNPDEILAKRKQELGQLLDSCIKHNYHMKLDLEQEVEKEVEIGDKKKGKKEKQKQWVWEPVPLETVLKDRKNYLLVNPSGMGKTTFLTYVACVLLDPDAQYPFLPLFFTSSAINNRVRNTIEDFIFDQVQSFYPPSPRPLVSPGLENLCILIDALDQARDVDDIVSSLDLHNKPIHYKNAKIILSSRQNTADKVKAGFQKIRLKLPEGREVEHYLGEENYKKLEGIIEASGELVKAPVLLEMLKIITEKGHVVSTLFNRAGLYTEFTKILFDEERRKPRFWQDPLSVRHFIDYELEQALEKIAFFSLVDNQILEIPKEKLSRYCESPVKMEALLNIGILLEFFEDREQKIVFRHQSFQAYFAARYIYYRQRGIFRELVSDIAFFYNDVWYEVMRFYVGLEKDPQKAEAIIDTIYQTEEKEEVDLNQALRLIFAFYLMSESQLSFEFVQRVYEQLRDLLTDNKHYLIFFILNIDKFNKANHEQRIKIHLIFGPLLRDKDSWIKLTTIEIFGELGTNIDISTLQPILLDNNSFIRSVIAEALGKIGTVEAKKILNDLLTDKSKMVRNKAVEMLGNLDKAKKEAHVIPIVQESHLSNFRNNTSDKIDISTDISILELQLKDEDDCVRSTAIKAFADIGTEKNIPFLEPLLRDVFVHEVTGKAIESIYKRSTPKLDIVRVAATASPKKKGATSFGITLVDSLLKTLFPLSVRTFPIHILHISDIHYAIEKDPSITCILYEFLQDIKKWRSQQNNSNIHSICITGDIAQSGQENQYLAIKEKIDAILNSTGCPIENLFIIPGNHDVQQYDQISDQGKTLLKKVKENKIDIDSNVLGNVDHFRLFHDKFANYYRFIENSGYTGSLPEIYNDSPRPWYKRKLTGFPVCIIGLNSALFCLKNKDFNGYGKIRIGTHQFHEAYFQGKVEPKRDDELVILMTHHPVNWLSENEYNEYSTLMERYSVIHLYGHIHKTKKKPKLFSSSDGYVSIGTGSLYGEKGTGDINTYHIITLDFEKGELFVWARRWNPDSGKWTVYDDDGNNRFPLPVKK